MAHYDLAIWQGNLIGVAFGGWLFTTAESEGEGALAVTALPACGLAALMCQSELSDKRVLRALPIGAIVLLGLASWIWTPPRPCNGIYVLLPDAPEVFEATYFKNYLEAITFAGIKAKEVVRPEDVPPGSFLLLPWLTSPFTNHPGDPVAGKIGELARERRWTVVVAGEHTDMGGAAERQRAIAGRAMLRRDLTVPPGNIDNSGLLHGSDLRAWPHEAILNRGASVRVDSLTDRVLLAGDAWWAEPDIGEWLWVGDYRWQPGNRAGRLTLAVSADIGGARWIVLGDNSFLINNQLVADPRPALRLLEMATLWPAFLRDIVVSGLAFFLLFPFAFQNWNSWTPFVAVGSATVFAFLGGFTSSRESIGWRDAYIGESGFDARNFNVSLAEHPALVQGRRLIRIKVPVSGALSLPGGKALIFMRVDGKAEIGGVKLSRCRRIGSLSTAEGPYLMDAQACRVDGSARVLIGTKDGAAAFAMSNSESETLVILDTAYLAKTAPDTNVKWLLKEVSP